MALLDFGGTTPITVSGTGAAPVDQVLDVGLYFASMTLLLNLFALKPSGGSPLFALKMETAMDVKGDNWVSLGNFANLSSAPSIDKQTFSNLLRYVRWNVTLTDISSAAFVLSGVARNP